MPRFMLSIATALSLLGAVGAARAADGCKLLSPADLAGKAMPKLRIYTGPDHESHIEASEIPADVVKMYGGKFDLSKFTFGPTGSSTLVSGPPNMAIPFHASPYAETFVILGGEATIEMPDGTKRLETPGMLISMEDTTSIKGHAGLTGPCGYLALSFTPPASK